ncbi:MAG: ABC transporter ATP-binding protein [Spirochaetia bacterium]|jgi:ABC-type Fe3+/spermidine/putrescine transport system ATPase subunit|nr:ABC transporter ATP-binding protein [Spirochaetia bacterium]
MVSLELINLTKAWPTLFVSVSLSIEAGRSLAIVGPSGCGKSTVLRMIAGLEPPDSGQVIVGGVDVSQAEPRSRGIGMVFQDYALFPHLDVGGNVEYGLRFRGYTMKARASTVAGLLDSVGLSGFQKRRAHELSGGERQRVALARTLATEPAIVLFDEPLSSLDASLRKRLRADLVEEQKRLGFTAVYVTHDLEEAMAIGDSLAVMDSGRVLQCASPEELWEHPSSAKLAFFMGSGPVLRIEGIDGSDGTIRTAAGRFGSDPTLLSAIEEHKKQGYDSFIFFERSAARPEKPVQVASKDSSFIKARCLSRDFAGDAIDCHMESGQERFSLRFTKDKAPTAGECRRYTIEQASLRVIPDIRTH